MGITTKEVNGREYVYHWRVENGRKRERYCGPARDGGSRRSALMMELEMLESRQTDLSERIGRVRASLGMLAG
ncbi:hypothetical protein IBTHAUMO2_690033 [Nitrosopumilaceae archaeon]|nr:hypothetical protein IBTHAUMO2_690033 [Nitrosopumilaceae archaeon]